MPGGNALCPPRTSRGTHPLSPDGGADRAGSAALVQWSETVPPAWPAFGGPDQPHDFRPERANEPLRRPVGPESFAATHHLLRHREPRPLALADHGPQMVGASTC